MKTGMTNFEQTQYTHLPAPLHNPVSVSVGGSLRTIGHFNLDTKFSSPIFGQNQNLTGLGTNSHLDPKKKYMNPFH